MARSLKSLWPRGDLWRHPDFLKLWSAQTISQFGSAITGLALPLAAILVLHASAFQVALLTTIDFLPFLLFSLPAGVWVDRLPRRPILIAGDLGRAAALVSIPAAAAFGALTIGQLYVVGFITGTLTVFFDVAYQSYLPSLVEREQLGDANGKLEVSRSGAQLAGPGLAGLLVGAVTAPYAIVVDAVSFLGSAAFVGAIRRGEPVGEPPVERPRMRREIAEGLRYVLGHPYLRPSMAYVAIANFSSNLLFSIFLVYAVRELRLSVTTIGLVFSLSNLGFLVGAVIANRLSLLLGIGRTMVGSAAIGGSALLLIPLAPRSLAVPFIVIAIAVTGGCGVIYNVTGISLMQAITPDRLLGRMNASRRFVVWGVIPLGGLAGGALASQIGLRPTIWVGAIGVSVAFVPLLFSPVRGLVRLPEEAPPLATVVTDA
jgi:MFS family permease